MIEGVIDACFVCLCFVSFCVGCFRLVVTVFVYDSVIGSNFADYTKILEGNENKIVN